MNQILRNRGLWVIALCLLLSASAAFGQSVTGELVGTIYDATGAVVPGATVTATNTETGIQATATVSTAGQYRLTNLAVGTYNLAVSAKGFSAAQIKNVVVSLSMSATTNV